MSTTGECAIMQISWT